MSTNSRLKQNISLIAIFIFGNFVIVFPKNNNLFEIIISLLICVFVTILVSILFANEEKTSGFLAAKKKGNLIDIVYKIFIFVISNITLYNVVNKYIMLVDEIRLPNTSALVLSLIFIVLAQYISKQNTKVILTISILTLIITLLAVIIIFIFSLPNFDISIINANGKLNVNSLSKTCVFCLTTTFGQMILVYYFLSQKVKTGKTKRTFLSGILLGIIVFLICFANVILVLGTNLASKMNYPYLTVGSAIIIGNSFCRMDGIIHLIIFLITLITATILFSIVFDVTNVFTKQLKKVIRIILVVAAIFVSASEKMRVFFNATYFYAILLIFEILAFSTLIIKKTIKN